MSAAATTPTDLPPPAAADQPRRAARLLSLVRKLINYGRALAAAWEEGPSARDIADASRSFGTRDIAMILARIKRGLLRATALEAGLASGKARLEPRSPEARGPRPPRLAHPVVPLPPLPDLVLLPTSAQIAAEIRRRPAGAVLADICRDLGILTNHPLWPEIHELLIPHGGNMAALYIDISRRVSALFLERCAAAAAEPTPPPGPPSPGPAATGPP